MSATDKPVYMVVWFTVKDLEEFISRYAIDVVGQLQRAGAELLAAGPPTVVEGDVKSNRAVVIRFPSMDAANGWYKSEEYLPFKKLRVEELASNGSAMFVEAFDPSALG